MRISAFVAMMLTAAVAFAPRPATAAYNLPWCAYYSDSSAYSCAFISMEQCLDSVRGIGGFCRPNFRYSFYPPDVERRRAKRRFDSGYH
jgi:hypothetical protein